MTSSNTLALLLGGALLTTIFSAGCSVRVGAHHDNGAAPGTGAADGGLVGPGVKPDPGPPPPPPSACARSGNETKVATPAGTDTFAFLWDVDHYVVAYSDKTTGNGDIYTLMLNADGTSRGAPQVVESTPSASDLPNILATQNGYLIAWEEGTAGKAVYVHAIDKQGAPLGKGVTVAATQSNEARPVLSYAPGGFAVAFMDKILNIPSVQVAFLDGNLKVLGPQRISQNSGGAGWPWVAGDDKGAGLLWSDRTKGQFDIHFANLDATLATTNDAPLRAGVANDALLGRMIKTSFGYLAAWEDMRADDNQIFMALTDNTGKKIAEGLVEEPDTGDANWPNMAWTGSSAGVVYYQFRADNPQIYISFIDGQGKRVGGLHDLQVSSTPHGSMARFPDVQWTGKEFGVAWVDTRDGSPQLYFARVACKS